MPDFMHSPFVQACQNTLDRDAQVSEEMDALQSAGTPICDWPEGLRNTLADMLIDFLAQNCDEDEFTQRMEETT